jgi:O-antigen biosynthesis protein WbqP
MKRFLDVFLSVCGLFFFTPLFVLIALIIKLSTPGPVLYWSSRIGKNGEIFKMPKFRSMKTNSPEIATHLLLDPNQYITRYGYYLRKYSLDELPQLWSILVGDMSFVGPRPALFNQNDLITLRTQHEVDKLVPGLTGWAQVNGRDELSIPNKVQYEVEYLHKQSFWFDIKILGLTFLKVVCRSGVSH